MTGAGPGPGRAGSKTAPALSKHGTVEVAGGHQMLGYQDSNLD